MKEAIRNEYKKQYDASTKRIDLIDIPSFNFIMIDGIGNPRVKEFQLKSQALKLVSIEVRRYFRKAKDLSYLIAPLEGLWDTYDNSHFDVTRKEDIRFTLMVAQPKLLDETTLRMIKEKLLDKNPYIKDIYLKRFTEGKCIQTLHKGPYETEIETTKKLMEYITVANMKLKGFHHEIYLNDASKRDPHKLRTIIRYPVE